MVTTQSNNITLEELSQFERMDSGVLICPPHRSNFSRLGLGAEVIGGGGMSL